MKKILMIATGGTIASVQTDVGLAPGLSAEDLLTAAPRISKWCEVEVVQPFNIDSTNITVAHWQQLVKVLEDNYEKYDGFVISHGTDTLAYTASALYYMVQGAKKPIVLTGSQLPMRYPETDAIRNLEDAFLYASDDDSMGICVVFGGRAIEGVRARKMRTQSLDAFESINYPQLAVVEGGKIYRNSKISVEGCDVKDGPIFCYDMNPDICVLKLTPDQKLEAFCWIMENVPGVILEGYGCGGIPESLRDAFFEKMKIRKEKRYLTVLATQAFYEGTFMDTYEVGQEAKRLTGIEECKDMTIEAVTAKMMWTLAQCQTK